MPFQPTTETRDMRTKDQQVLGPINNIISTLRYLFPVEYEGDLYAPVSNDIRNLLLRQGHGLQEIDREFWDIVEGYDSYTDEQKEGVRGALLRYGEAAGTGMNWDSLVSSDSAIAQDLVRDRDSRDNPSIDFSDPAMQNQLRSLPPAFDKNATLNALSLPNQGGSFNPLSLDDRSASLNAPSILGGSSFRDSDAERKVDVARAFREGFSYEDYLQTRVGQDNPSREGYNEEASRRSSLTNIPFDPVTQPLEYQNFLQSDKFFSQIDSAVSGEEAGFKQRGIEDEMARAFEDPAYRQLYYGDVANYLGQGGTDWRANTAEGGREYVESLLGGDVTIDSLNSLLGYDTSIEEFGPLDDPSLSIEDTTRYFNEGVADPARFAFEQDIIPSIKEDFTAQGAFFSSNRSREQTKQRGDLERDINSARSREQMFNMRLLETTKAENARAVLTQNAGLRDTSARLTSSNLQSLEGNELDRILAEAGINERQRAYIADIYSQSLRTDAGINANMEITGDANRIKGLAILEAGSKIPNQQAMSDWQLAIIGQNFLDSRNLLDYGEWTDMWGNANTAGQLALGYAGLQNQALVTSPGWGSTMFAGIDATANLMGAVSPGGLPGIGGPPGAVTGSALPNPYM